jgi:hypothetical protein
VLLLLLLLEYRKESVTSVKGEDLNFFFKSIKRISKNPSQYGIHKQDFCFSHRMMDIPTGGI